MTPTRVSQKKLFLPDQTKILNCNIIYLLSLLFIMYPAMRLRVSIWNIKNRDNNESSKTFKIGYRQHICLSQNLSTSTPTSKIDYFDNQGEQDSPVFTISLLPSFAPRLIGWSIYITIVTAIMCITAAHMSALWMMAVYRRRHRLQSFASFSTLPLKSFVRYLNNFLSNFQSTILLLLRYPLLIKILNVKPWKLCKIG